MTIYSSPEAAVGLFVALALLFGTAAWKCYQRAIDNREPAYSDALAQIYRRVKDGLYPALLSAVVKDLADRVRTTVPSSDRMSARLARLCSEPKAAREDAVALACSEIAEDVASIVGGRPPEIGSLYGLMRSGLMDPMVDAVTLRSLRQSAQRWFRPAWGGFAATAAASLLGLLPLFLDVVPRVLWGGSLLWVTAFAIGVGATAAGTVADFRFSGISTRWIAEREPGYDGTTAE